ncbi:MAG: hypothetical protein ACI8RD_001168 [Bacillariaceae sp.]|jgi:hypothetical protein
MYHPSANHSKVHSSCILLLSAFFIRSVVVALQTPLLSSLSSSPGIRTYKEKKGFESCYLPLNIDVSNTITMIVRVRSNLGTMKFSIEDDTGATESTVRDAVMQECRQRQQRDNNTSKKYKLTQALSFDPSCSRTIDPNQTLFSQGIRHGSMVYCRLEETEAEAAAEEENLRHPLRDAKISKISGGKEKVIAKKEIDVIDLIDSSDEEEGCRTDDNKKQPQSRKRQRSAIDNNDNSITSRQARTSSKSTKSSNENDNNSNHSNFQIASYNVWFGPPDEEARQVFPEKRMAGIVEGLQMASKIKRSDGSKSSPLLFVGLQELTPSLVQYLKPQFQNIGYNFCTQPLGFGGASYGVGVAVSKELKILEQRFVPYRNSIQGRGFLFVRTPTLLLVTTHLESWCGPQFTGAAEREQQIIEVAVHCQEQLDSTANNLELAVILGDLNWDDERKQKRSIPPNRNLLSILSEGWHDAGTQFDFTYDAKENPMLNGNLRRRLDRCIYIRSQRQEQNYKSTGLQKVGKKAIPNIVWNKKNSYNGSIKPMPVAPSDHFGIMISFSKK